jgi:hypothetical protein
MKNIRDYISDKSKTLVQARIDTTLVEQVREVMSRENLTWTELLSACFKKFLDENKKEAL